MPRRSTSPAQLAQRNYPIRVRYAVPRFGLGTLTDDISRWMRLEVEDGAGALTSGGWWAGGQAAEAHFLQIEDAAAFIAYLGELGLELADGTEAGRRRPQNDKGPPPVSRGGPV